MLFASAIILRHSVCVLCVPSDEVSNYFKGSLLPYLEPTYSSEEIPWSQMSLSPHTNNLFSSCALFKFRACCITQHYLCNNYAPSKFPKRNSFFLSVPEYRSPQKKRRGNGDFWEFLFLILIPGLFSTVFSTNLNGHKCGGLQCGINSDSGGGGREGLLKEHPWSFQKFPHHTTFLWRLVRNIH